MLSANAPYFICCEMMLNAKQHTNACRGYPFNSLAQQSCEHMNTHSRIQDSSRHKLQLCGKGILQCTLPGSDTVLAGDLREGTGH